MQIFNEITPQELVFLWKICIFAAYNHYKNKLIMNKQHFKAQVNIGGILLNTLLEVVFFREAPYTIAYCPALDLSAAGRNQKQVKEEFAQVFAEYAEDCIKNNTLREDLQAHGWIVKDGAYNAPTMTQMLIGNDTLRDIIDNKDYYKQMVVIPQVQHTMAMA